MDPGTGIATDVGPLPPGFANIEFVVQDPCMLIVSLIDKAKALDVSRHIVFSLVSRLVIAKVLVVLGQKLRFVSRLMNKFAIRMLDRFIEKAERKLPVADAADCIAQARRIIDLLEES